ncbi:MAG: arginine--tRNA ligase [Fimbriiglobus sp.]|nr:arginine--tRNA ligase [Fimbriiglobus sp.]
MNLLNELRSLFEPALLAVGADPAKVPDYLGMVKPSADAKHGDYQANFAMPLAKVLGKKPPEVAKEIIDATPTDGVIEPPTVAGPGFINLKLTDAWIAEQVQTIAASDRLGVAMAATPKTFVIDYSGPNVAKPLHVGHLRSTIIGDALVRLLRFLGHTVVGDNHLGDWGTQFGMLIYGYRTFLNKEAYKSDPVRELARLYVLVRNVGGTIDILSNAFTNFRDQAAFEADPVAELTRLYVNGLKRAKGSDDDDDEAKGPFVNPVADAYRRETAKLHAGDADNLKLWQEFMPACMEEIHKVYRQLDILPMDHELGESFYQPMLAGVVEELQAKGVSETGDGGSVIIRFGENNVALIRKRDGAFTYTTTDLATIKHRIATWKPDAVLYVVDFRQGHHFKNLFTAAERWGFSGVEFNHVSFGSVLGKDGKPLKTRDGGVPELSTLLDRAVELGGHLFELIHWQRAAMGHDVPKWDEISDAEKQEIARVVGIGAVKYADLSQSRTSDYRFDFDKMLATNGNTATYMQYAYARCRSIFRKGNADEKAFRTRPPKVLLTHPAERALAVQLLKFEEVLSNAAAEYLPHYITQYLWDVAKAFSGFFEGCPVLTAGSEELKASRLLLTDLTARTIQTALGLLGIRTVERM